jgi:hypothetical protein
MRVEEALGRVLDGLGEPIDGGAAVARLPEASPSGFLRRSVGVADRFETGVAGLDALSPIGRGARVAVIGEAGSGKTYLLRQLRERMSEDVVVIGLVGERARERPAVGTDDGGGGEFGGGCIGAGCCCGAGCGACGRVARPRALLSAAAGLADAVCAGAA